MEILLISGSNQSLAYRRRYRRSTMQIDDRRSERRYRRSDVDNRRLIVDHPARWSRSRSYVYVNNTQHSCVLEWFSTAQQKFIQTRDSNFTNHSVPVRMVSSTIRINLGQVQLLYGREVQFLQIPNVVIKGR